MLCNDPEVINSVTTFPGISDHEVLIGTIPCDPLKIQNPLPRTVLLKDLDNFDGTTQDLFAFLPELADLLQIHGN